MKMQFTDMEYRVLARSAERLLKARSKLAASEWKKPQHKAVKIFASKFSLLTQLDGSDQTVSLDRNILRLIQEVCTMSKEALEKSVIPEYQRRGLDDERNKEYFTKAVALADAYTKLLQKAEAAL